MDKTPVYQYPASHARESDELELYRASHKVNTVRAKLQEASEQKPHSKPPRKSTEKEL